MKKSRTFTRYIMFATAAIFAVFATSCANDDSDNIEAPTQSEKQSSVVDVPKNCVLSPPEWLHGYLAGDGIELLVDQSDIVEGNGDSFTAVCNNEGNVYIREGRKEDNFYSFTVRTKEADGGKLVQGWLFRLQDDETVLVTHSFSYASKRSPNLYKLRIHRS